MFARARSVRTTLVIQLLGASLVTAVAAAPPPFAAPFLSYPLAFGPGSLELADVNSDGRPDLLVTHQGTIDVLLGSPDGSFSFGTPAPGGLATVWSDGLAVGDLDGDGDTDLVVVRDTVSVGVARGDGLGHFSALSSVTVATPTALLIADFNGDTVPDLASVSSRANLVSILLGAGDGTFGPPATFATGGRPISVATADIDLDGDLDLVIGNQQTQTLTRLLGDGAGNFTSTSPLTLPGMPTRIVLARLDADALPDIAVGSNTTNEFFVLAGTGGGGFAPAQGVAMGDVVTGLVVGDLDHDGVLDVAGTLYYQNAVAVRRGLGGLSFAPVMTYTAERAPIALALADVNGGGKLDLVALGSFSSVSVHMGNGDGTFGGRPDRSVGDAPWEVTAGDLDGDGRADLVTANIGTHTLSVAHGLGDGTFATPVTLAAGIEPRHVCIADVNEDQLPDLVVANNGPGTQSFSTVSVFLGNGALGFGPRADFQVGRWSQHVAVGDLNGDGHADLAVALNDFGPTLSVLDGQGNGQFVNRHDYVIGSNAASVAIGDVTRDGKPDIVLSGYSSNSAYVLAGNATGTYGAPIALPTPGNAYGVGIGDVDGDGFRDVVVGHVGVTVFRSLPGGTFAPGLTAAAGGGPLAVADLDADGRADAVTANNWPDNSLSVLFGQPAGSLAGRVELGAGDRPMAVAIADLDGDTRPDLLSANLASNSVSVMLNTGGVAWLPWLGAPPPTPGGTAFTVWPNPSHGELNLAFELPRTMTVRLRLYDLSGRVLETLADASYAPGPHRWSWSRARGGVAAGVYFTELIAGGERRVRRVVLLP